MRNEVVVKNVALHHYAKTTKKGENDRTTVDYGAEQSISTVPHTVHNTITYLRFVATASRRSTPNSCAVLVEVGRDLMKPRPTSHVVRCMKMEDVP
jgi:hypothetical protein